MNVCLECKSKTDNPKFCCQSCSAKYNNRGVRRHGKPPGVCLECGNPKKSSIRKYCSSLCQQKYQRKNMIPTNCERCGKDKKNIAKLCNSCHVTVSRRQTIKKLKLICGGKCKICNYSKCLNALDFHHIDPTKKKFTISSGDNVGYTKLLNETKKCILVCSNCHREIHSKKKV